MGLKRPHSHLSPTSDLLMSPTSRLTLHRAYKRFDKIPVSDDDLLDIREIRCYDWNIVTLQRLTNYFTNEVMN